MNTKFCPVPWSYLALKNNGDFRVCCHANTSPEKGLLRKKDQSKFNIVSDKVTEARQSELISALRLSMINNETHANCIRCDKEDDAGLKSRRQYEKDRTKDVLTLEQAIAVTNPEGQIDISKMPVRFMDLRFGNRCNLKCRMCGPTDSEAWYEDYVGAWNKTTFNDSGETISLEQNTKGKWITTNDKYHWVDENHSWDEIKDNLDEVEYLYIVGGEPLLIAGHLEILQECIARDRASKITLEYNTNLTLLPDEVLDAWKKFKLVRIGISVDGIKEVNDYIRSPSKWTQIEFNLKKLVSHNQSKTFEIWFSLTYQAYNSFHVIKVFEWIKKDFILSSDEKLVKISLKTHPLHKPDHLSVKIFNPKIKQELKCIYENYIAQLNEEKNSSPEFRKFVKNTTDTLLGFIRFMEDEDLSAHLDTFLRYTKDLDRLRQENVSSVIPEIGRLING